MEYVSVVDISVDDVPEYLVSDGLVGSSVAITTAW